MSKKRKRKKSLAPRCKRMKRPARLASAKAWIPKYPGKNIVRGYAKHYGVDLLCAATELQMIGAKVDPGYIRQLKAIVEAKAEAGRRKKEKEREAEELEEYGQLHGSDEYYAFIAGFTSGGAPFGVTWEEVEEIEDVPGESP